MDTEHESILHALQTLERYMKAVEQVKVLVLTMIERGLGLGVDFLVSRSLLFEYLLCTCPGI